jgi:hypothetical protein
MQEMMAEPLSGHKRAHPGVLHRLSMPPRREQAHYGAGRAPATPAARHHKITQAMRLPNTLPSIAACTSVQA